jgi:[citrate (pro-3S)-lyase] ligase
VGGGGGGGVIPVLTLKELLVELNGRDADILVSNFDEEVIKGIHRIFTRTKFTKNTVIYFYHSYDITKKKFANLITWPGARINGKITYRSDPSFCLNKNVEHNFSMLKDAYFDCDSYNKLVEVFTQRNKTIHFKNRRLSRFPPSDSENKETAFQNKIIYIFGDSRFSLMPKPRVDLLLSPLLNRNGNYKIENYSFGSLNDKRAIHQLTCTPLVKDSIVIIAHTIYDPYLLGVAKLYCCKYNCRLIYYFIPKVIFRKNFSDWEKYFMEDTDIKNIFTIENENKNKKKLEVVARAMGMEFYEPPGDFFYSDKTIFIDHLHFSDHGCEIIAKHLHDIITNKIEPDNFYDNFCISIKEKIEYANSVIFLMMSDIQTYLADLKKHRQNFENCGSIVMNCNPFTLGHRYLIEYAASKVEHLYIFVVEEDKSDFSFSDRYMLVKKNTADLENVTVLSSGKFIISSITFAGYFDKSQTSEEQAVEQDVSLDLLIFAASIAPELNIKKRFVGQEPFDPVTRHYNEEMKKILPEYGCEVVEIPRLEENGSAVSASRVRKLLKERNFQEIRKIVPEATLKFLLLNRQ